MKNIPNYLKQIVLLLPLIMFNKAFGQVSKKPNIVIIVADDLGWNDVGFRNPDIISPNLDDLASKGVELSRFYVASICSPTRAGLLTGKYPDRFGIRDNVIRPNFVGGLPLEEQTLADILAHAGYPNRGAFGKWHLGHSDTRYHPLNRGFTTFYGHYNGALDYFSHEREGQVDWHMDFEPSKDIGYTVDLVSNEASRFISKSAKEGKPFLAYVAFNGVHGPLQAKAEDLLVNGFDPTKGVHGDQQTIHGKGNDIRQTFKALVTSLDRGVGHILSTIEQADIADNTIIWFLSDNGGTPKVGGSNLPLRGNKNTEWEGGVRSTSLVYWKGKVEGGKQIDQVLSFVDVVPTIGFLAGAELPPNLDGVNIQPALEGKAIDSRVLFLGREALVADNWKVNKGELFNLDTDPYEKEDVAKQNPNVFKKLDACLKEFQKIVLPFSLLKQPDHWQPPVDWKVPDFKTTDKSNVPQPVK
ncbi:arylsulfatase B [Sphingobacterium corticibacterium]|uniref:Arylsulfatase n=1 Tax=Sphingobacterium corticibacterium TaxID=2484746 RepID=A0A4Q6XFU2_9SPHI|nr:arylsulfatase [Sphingobacterium corticibacterium]RZF58333.1 arylsulfatase [Sphingobacterium corticibacterium]